MRGPLVVALVLLASTHVDGQNRAESRTDAAKGWTQPRTPWGDPDLQGVWDNSTATPLERPRELGTREFFTEEEVRARNEAAENSSERAPQAGDPGTYNAVWFDRGKILPDRRTSLIVDPPDGRLPALTPQAQQRYASSRASVGRAPDRADSWEDRTLWERCIASHPVPAMPSFYNNNRQIVQALGYVAILSEEIHETRIIPLDGRPHLSPAFKLWLGDSRGRWEGNTLVVETTNLRDNYDVVLTPPATILHDANVRIIERFTRTNADTIEYRFTVIDPTTYTAPFTAVLPMRKADGLVYEYACHEGNYSMTQMLNGARVLEKAAGAAAKPGSAP